jgi:hypothetical protein
VVSGLVADAYADRFADGREFLVARTARALADHLLSVLRQPEAHQVMVDRARGLVLQDSSVDGMRTQARRAVSTLVQARLVDA